ncbi:HGGxSTG domain-containing protein [Pseudomonas fluorescens]|uniref:HGGxSTG domain-containing protein n=1 Tax=Pseudomonas fluorescens TaxID=294 RepID=UPI002ACAD653|nr:HGGxSTG domain-containing protein [Pseudomonas fluorescens]MDZ5432879.1 HGGxSTG domain-containing protein [Pseudomonas fluorescens]
MANDQVELRKLWKIHHKANEAVMLAWLTGGMRRGQPCGLPFPDELRGMTCGAKTRAGTPCKRRDLYKSGRCRLHGGLSTGPKSNPMNT